MGSLHLHIGPHKTGSTYIQKRLVDAEKQLAKVGIKYPKKWRDVLWGHHTMVVAIKSPVAKEAGDVQKLVREVCNSDDVVVLSSELFENLEPDEIQFVFGGLPVDVHVHYFCRSWPGLVYSNWQEKIKQGEECSLPAFALEHYARPFQSRMMNYDIPLGKYRKALPECNISLYSYDDIVSSGGDLFEAFIREVSPGIDVDALPLARKEVNASLSEVDIGLIRQLNRKYYSISEKKFRTSVVREAYFSVKNSIKDWKGVWQGALDPWMETVILPEKNYAAHVVDQTLKRNYPGQVIGSEGLGAKSNNKCTEKYRYLTGEFLADLQMNQLFDDLFSRVSTKI